VVLGGRLGSGSGDVIGSEWAPVKATQLPLGEKKATVDGRRGPGYGKQHRGGEDVTGEKEQIPVIEHEATSPFQC
jgi:hypothetical protein